MTDDPINEAVGLSGLAVLVHEVFGKLYTQTRYRIDVIKPLMPTD